MDNFEKETSAFTNPDLGSEESFVTELLKGILGAVIGAIPGFALWLIIAKLGYVSSLCGALIAIGSAYGFAFMTKKSSMSPIIGIVVSLIVMAVAVLLAIRIDWAWEIAKFFEEVVIPEYEATLSSFGISAAESRELLEEELMNELGFKEATFGNCFSHLNDLLEYFELKSDYNGELLKGGLFALLGSTVLFSKLKK